MHVGASTCVRSSELERRPLGSPEPGRRKVLRSQPCHGHQAQDPFQIGPRNGGGGGKGEAGKAAYFGHRERGEQELTGACVLRRDGQVVAADASPRAHRRPTGHVCHACARGGLEPTARTAAKGGPRPALKGPTPHHETEPHEAMRGGAHPLQPSPQGKQSCHKAGALATIEAILGNDHLDGDPKTCRGACILRTYAVCSQGVASLQ